jgi:hypothetical protein
MLPDKLYEEAKIVAAEAGFGSLMSLWSINCRATSQFFRRILKVNSHQKFCRDSTRLLKKLRRDISSLRINSTNISRR